MHTHGPLSCTPELDTQEFQDGPLTQWWDSAAFFLFKQELFCEPCKPKARDGKWKPKVNENNQETETYFFFLPSVSQNWARQQAAYYAQTSASTSENVVLRCQYMEADVSRADPGGETQSQVDLAVG